MATFFANLSTLEWVYLALLCSGLFYAFFLALFGFGHGAGHAGDVGHAGDLGHGGVGHVGDLGHGGAGHVGDLGHGGAGHAGDMGHAGAGHAADGAHLDQMADYQAQGGAVHISPWNPIVIATFIGCFGGFGLLGTRGLHLHPLLSLVLATPSALVLAAGIFFLYATLITQAGVSSAASWQEVQGAAAQVVTPIPENGVGEIVYEVRGMRYNSPARGINGQAIPRDAHVTILQVKDSIAFVDIRYID